MCLIELGVFILEKKRLREDLTAAYNCLKGGWGDGGGISLYWVSSDGMRGNGLNLYRGRDSGWDLGKFLHY